MYTYNVTQIKVIKDSYNLVLEEITYRSVCRRGWWSLSKTGGRNTNRDLGEEQRQISNVETGSRYRDRDKPLAPRSRLRNKDNIEKSLTDSHVAKNPRSEEQRRWLKRG